MNHITSIKTIEDIENYIDVIFNYLKDNENIYHMILSSNDPLMFASRLNKYMTKEISNILKNTNNKDLLLAISFFCDGSINLIIKYFRNEISITLDETKSFIKTMAKTILREY